MSFLVIAPSPYARHEALVPSLFLYLITSIDVYGAHVNT